jgi:glucose-1-phosphate cytidylyltransferase
MKVAILAGGQGTRLSEETAAKPKPMVEVGGKPLLWHIMNIYAAHGFREFVIALGYKGEVIKDYFLNYRYRARSLTIDLGTGSVRVHEGNSEDWVVELLDTGLTTQTGGRVKLLSEFIGHEPFMLTYGDGVGNINISELLAFHRRQGRVATVTAVCPPARFGHMLLQGETVREFEEKPITDQGLVSAGFFVFQPEILDYIKDEQTILERDPLERLAASGQLVAYRHSGFWHAMDTFRDVHVLNKLWAEGEAPWKIWR